MKRAILAMVILGIVAASWFLIFHRKKDTSSYRFVAVERGTIESVVSSTGTLRATSTVQVGTQVSGQIEAIYVDFNDQVKQGQLIARIDPTLLEQEVRSAQTAVERARAELDQATREMNRVERLYEGKVVTDSEHSTSQYQLAVAKTSYESAQINLDKAQRNLKYSDIQAPVDGTVLERNVDVGQTVAASLQAPQLFLIAGDLSEMEIVALVDEGDIGKIEPDQEVRFTVQAFPDRYFQGKVRQVRLQSTMQENVVTYLVAVAVDNQDGKLLPGMTATVEFIVKRVENILKVANTALRFQPTEAMRAEMQARRGEVGMRGGAGDSVADSTGSSGSGRGRSSPAAAGGASGGGRERTGRAGGARRADRGILWTADENGKIDVIPVKVGITDGQFTEIEGPKAVEGLQVIAAVTTSAAAGATNPFDNRPSQSGPGRGPRPGF